MIARLRKLLSLPSRYALFARDWKDYCRLAEAAADDRFQLTKRDHLAMVWERSETTSFDAHYVYHNAWAVRRIAELSPERHVDISSTLYFCTTLSAILPVEFYDFRPAELTLDNLVCGRADLTRLHFDDDAIQSLSCMHVVEHIGLGRYGDPLDPTADLRAVEELKRVLAPGGTLLFVTPVGQRSLKFNAHRIYDFAAVEEMFAGYDLVASALVTDDARFIETPEPAEINRQTYGCGCFLFRKPKQPPI